VQADLSLLQPGTSSSAVPHSSAILAPPPVAALSTTSPDLSGGSGRRMSSDDVTTGSSEKRRREMSPPPSSFVPSHSVHGEPRPVGDVAATARYSASDPEPFTVVIDGSSDKNITNLHPLVVGHLLHQVGAKFTTVRLL